MSHFPSPRFVSALPESLAVFYQVPILYRDGYWCVRGESPSPAFPPHHRLGGMLFCRSAKILTGCRRDESCSTLGSFSRHISDMVVFLENLTDTKLKSKQPPMLSSTSFFSLFFYCTVCKSQIFSRIYFCNPRFSFVSEEEEGVFFGNQWGEMSQVFLTGYLYSRVTFGVFWGVCTCPNRIYTTFPIPLYSYLVCPVIWNFEFIHNNYYFFAEFHWDGSRNLTCHALLSLKLLMMWMTPFKMLLLLPAVLLNAFWDNAMLCSWYKKHLFLVAWLVLWV